MRVEDLLLIVTCSFNLYLSFLVLFRNKHKKNFAFFILVQALNLYFISNALVDLVNNINLAFLFTRILFSISSFLPLVLLIFTTSFLNKLSKPIKIGVLILSLIATFNAFLALTSHTIIKDVDLTQFPVALVYGPFYDYFNLLSIAQVAYIFVVMLFVFRKLVSIEKLQFKYFTWGIAITAILILLTNAVLPTLFDIDNFVRYPAVFSVIFTSTATYSIIKHKLFSIKTVTLETIKVISLGLSFFLIVLGLRVTKDVVFDVGIYSSQAMIIDLISAVIVAGLSDPFLKYVNNKLQKIIKPEVYTLRGLVDTIEEDAGNNLDFELVLNNVLKVLNKYFADCSISIIKVNENNSLSVFPEKGVIFDLGMLKIIEGIYVTQEHTKENNFLQETLVNSNIAIISTITENLFISFSNKKNKEAYTRTEIEIIAEVIDNLKDIFVKVEIFQKTNEFNQILQQRVDEATQELQKTNVELEDALRKERDMMDVLGHELRTPLSIARNAIMMMDMAYKAGSYNEVKFKELVEKSKENIRREVTLLETVLSSTRIENKKINVNFVKVDCNDVINDSLDAFREEAAKKNLKIITEVPTNILYAWGGREQTQEVLDNLISNAIKYTNQGSVTIKLEDESVNIRFSVTDTGMGIPENEIANLGKKFHRVNPYLANPPEGVKIVRAGGTGIGLYVVFGLLDLMKGKLDIKSKLGEGSTFSFTLPKYANQDVVPAPAIEQAQTNPSVIPANGPTQSQTTTTVPSSNNTQPESNQSEGGSILPAIKGVEKVQPPTEQQAEPISAPQTDVPPTSGTQPEQPKVEPAPAEEEIKPTIKLNTQLGEPQNFEGNSNKTDL